MTNDLCPECGAYWQCECKKIYKPLTLEVVRKAALDSFFKDNPVGTSGTNLTEEDISRILREGPAK